MRFFVQIWKRLGAQKTPEALTGQQAAESFLEKARRDQSIKTAVSRILNDTQVAQQNSLDAVLQYATELGYCFTQSDVKTALSGRTLTPEEKALVWSAVRK